MDDGLQKDGGINFGRKKNFGKPKKEPYGLGKPESPEEEVEEPVVLSVLIVFLSILILWIL